MRVKDLHAGYGTKEVLHGIDYTFPAQKIIAIVGQSGCGKSTFLKCLNRMVQHEGGWMKGELTLNNQNAMTMAEDALRQHIGMVTQQPVVFPFSIAKNLSLVLDYYNVPKKEQQEKMEAILNRVGLWDEVKERLTQPASKLSGGQKQRLAIARAFCAEPSVLLLDEPCSALDLKNTIALEEMLLRVKNQYTIVIVTHNLAQAKRIADEVIYMDAGKIVEATEKTLFFESPQTQLAKEQIKLM